MQRCGICTAESRIQGSCRICTGSFQAVAHKRTRRFGNWRRFAAAIKKNASWLVATCLIVAWASTAHAEREEVVPDFLLEALEESDTESKASVDYFELARACLALDEEDGEEEADFGRCMEYSSDIIGVDEKKQRLVELRVQWSEGAGFEGASLNFYRWTSGDKPRLELVETRKLIDIWKDDDVSWNHADVWQAVADLEEDYSKPRHVPLVYGQNERTNIVSYPLVRMGAPLDGWMLYFETRDLTIRLLLVAPDNHRSSVLGSFEVEVISPEDEEEGLHSISRLDNATVGRVVTSPDGRALIVTWTARNDSYAMDTFTQHIGYFPIPE